MSLGDLVLFALQAVLSLVFLGAGGAKAADVSSFETTLTGLRVPPPWAGAVARAVIATELVLGTLGLAGIGWPTVSVLMFAMALGFVVVTAAAARWRPQVRCRCFGALAESRFGRSSLLRSVLLAAAAGLCLLRFDAPAGARYGVLTSVLLVMLAVLIAAIGAAAATAIDAVRRGATSP